MAQFQLLILATDLGPFSSTQFCCSFKIPATEVSNPIVERWREWIPPARGKVLRGLCCLGRHELLAYEDWVGGSLGGLPTLSQVPADLLALPRTAPMLAERRGEARGSEAVVVPWLARGMLASPHNRQQSPAMVTSPLCVCTLHLFLLQVWQHNKLKGLTPAAYGKTPHVAGVAPVSQQDMDGTSSMCPSASLQLAAAHPVK